MTTVDKVHNIFMSFKGRSPRQVYLDASKEFNAKINSNFANFLSDKIDDFYYLEDLDLARNYFGPKGCMAVLKIVQSQQRLKSVNLSSCGVDDIVVAELVEVMQDHPRLRDINLSDNPNISVFSGKSLSLGVKLNVNLINLDLSNTHVGRNVANVLQATCRKNKEAMELYFSDDWFRMKDMFIGLDVDGSSWVNIKNMLGSVIYPMIQEKLQERIIEMRPKKREDNCIDVTTFFELTYLNFKNKDEMVIHSEISRDAPYDTIVGNWASLLKAITAAGAVCTNIGRVALREYALSDASAKAIVDDAIPRQKAKTEEDGEAAQEVVDISPLALLQSVKTKGVPVSPTLAKRRQSFLDRQEKKTFSIPPSICRAILTAFDAAPPNGYLVSKFLDMTLQTDFEWLNLNLLREKFALYSVPIDVTQITVEEAVNLCDEYYSVIRVPKLMSIELVKKIVEA